MTRRTIMNALISLPIAGAAVATPALAVPSMSDRQPADERALFEIEGKIFELKEAIEELNPEIKRLGAIRDVESHRLYDLARLNGNVIETERERWSAVTAMPEVKEHDRLVNLQQPLRDTADSLVERMWAIPAHTSEGRRAKLVVLLGYVMPDDWRHTDEEADYGIREARDLLIEFVGGAPAAQLRDQFASGPTVESPPISPPAAPAVNRPDADLLALGAEFEALLAAEKPLKTKMEDLSDQADRLRYERMGIDPDDAEARNRAAQDRWQEWMQVRAAAGTEIGCDKAYDLWNRASEKTGRLGKKILKIKPITAAGLLVRARVIETHDEICEMEAPEQLMAEIKAFAKAA
jgi:hypothetical protein